MEVRLPPAVKLEAAYGSDLAQSRPTVCTPQRNCQNGDIPNSQQDEDAFQHVESSSAQRIIHLGGI